MEWIATLVCNVTNFEHVYITVGIRSKSRSHIHSISSSCLFFKLKILLREVLQNNIIFKQTFHF